jgi:hypothetical protein
MRWGLAVVLLLTLASTVGAQTAPTSQPIPDWLSWKVFYDSLTFYSSQSMSQVRELLTTQLGLSSAEIPAFLAASQEFVSALGRIDTDASSELDKRFGVDLPKPPLPDNLKNMAIPQTRPIQVQPGQSGRDLAVSAGIDARVEAQKNAAFAKHRADLVRTLGNAKVTKLAAFVGANVAPHITRTSAPLAPRRAQGSGLPSAGK